ncbi:PAS domain-containing protein [uncultured Sphaerochaeta sp.]|uniref:helix-turn-helix transcriptional regulator n=1 Tax=uncultured Sphaerochaeta sp. TaxID=886478 RepID=UPI002A0A3BAD|nr:PAS domain-containing protein [uncultured Sphaerochaeta sp.]
MKLSKTNKLIMDSYANMIEGLSTYLGSACEISLHSLEDYNHSVVKIMNGYHSGRSVGAPLTDLALNMLKRISDQGLSATESYTSYNAINQAGEHLKSSTISVIGENNCVIGMLCINFYMDSPLSEILQSLLESKSEQPKNEYFANSMSDAITEAVNDARNQVMLNSNIPAINKNKELIRILYGKGVFRIKDSVSRVADALGISKNTVYLHLRHISE